MTSCEWAFGPGITRFVCVTISACVIIAMLAGMRVGEARKPGPEWDPFGEDFDCGLFDSLGCADGHRFESFWLDREDAPEGPDEEESGGLGGEDVVIDTPPLHIPLQLG